MCFLSLRQRTDTVQALVSVSEGKISKQMVKWVAGLQDESIVLVEGTVTVPPEIIKSATVGNIEIHVDQVCALDGRRSDWTDVMFLDSLDLGTGSTIAIFP